MDIWLIFLATFWQSSKPLTALPPDRAAGPLGGFLTYHVNAIKFEIEIMDRRVLTPPKRVKQLFKQALSGQQKQPRPQGAFP